MITMDHVRRRNAKMMVRLRPLSPLAGMLVDLQEQAATFRKRGDLYQALCRIGHARAARLCIMLLPDNDPLAERRENLARRLWRKGYR